MIYRDREAQVGGGGGGQEEEEEGGSLFSGAREMTENTTDLAARYDEF